MGQPCGISNRSENLRRKVWGKGGWRTHPPGRLLWGGNLAADLPPRPELIASYPDPEPRDAISQGKQGPAKSIQVEFSQDLLKAWVCP